MTSALAPPIPISDVRFTAATNARNELLVAYVDFTLHGWIRVRDAKLLRRPDGRLFVRLPSRKARLPCRHCGGFNDGVTRFCAACGRRDPCPRAPSKTHYDSVYATSAEGQARLADALLEEFVALARSGRAMARPGEPDTPPGARPDADPT